MIRRNTRILSILAITAVMLACVPTLSPASAPIPTFDPNSINTVIAQTAEAAATQTALMMPPTFTATATPLPTSTSTETPTPTFLFILDTVTVMPTLITPGTSDAEYDCQIVSRNPANDSIIARGSAFKMTWQVVNIGTATWFSSDTDFRYISGKKMHDAAINDLDNTVMPGSTIDLIVNMQAPADPGNYKTMWKLNIGKNSFCPLDLAIIVK